MPFTPYSSKQLNLGGSLPQSSSGFVPYAPEGQGSSHGLLYNSLSNLSGIARFLGLGLAPDVAGGADVATQKIAGGRSPFSVSNPAQTAQENTNDPFISPEDRQSIAQGGLIGGLGRGAQNAAGVSSWMLPGSGLLPMTIKGGLYGASQQGATPTSIVGNAAASGILGKLLGLLSHPIENTAGAVDNTLAKSGKSVDMGKILNQYQREALPEFAKRGQGADAIQGFNKLQTNVGTAVNAFQPHVDAMNSATGQIPMSPVASMKLPIQDANELARNFTHGVSYGGDTGMIDNESKKAFGRILKGNIHQQVPAASALDSFMHNVLYPAPDFINSLAAQTGFGRAAQKVATLPLKLMQKTIPATGAQSPYSWLLPLLFNASGFGKNYGDSQGQ